MTWPALTGLLLGSGIARYLLWPAEQRLQRRHLAVTADRVATLRRELDELIKEQTP